MKLLYNPKTPQWEWAYSTVDEARLRAAGWVDDDPKYRKPQHVAPAPVAAAAPAPTEAPAKPVRRKPGPKKADPAA